MRERIRKEILEGRYGIDNKYTSVCIDGNIILMKLKVCVPPWHNALNIVATLSFSRRISISLILEWKKFLCPLSMDECVSIFSGKLRNRASLTFLPSTSAKNNSFEVLAENERKLRCLKFNTLERQILSYCRADIACFFADVIRRFRKMKRIHAFTRAGDPIFKDMITHMQTKYTRDTEV